MKVYMDHAATTPVREEVLEEMRPYFAEKFGNPSSLHSYGREAAEAVALARGRAAKVMNAKPDEIKFTSGGTEANNLAIKGVASSKGRGHVITSNIEHDCVLEAASWLERRGFAVTRLPVNRDGLVGAGDVAKAMRKDTILVSVMHANNEIGTIQPIEEIGRLCRERNVLFHTDAVQTFGKIPIDVSRMSIDMLSVSAHKIYGPKGVGMLFVRGGVRLDPLIHGGGQERGLRSGTENVAGIVGLGKAAELANKEMSSESKRLSTLRNILVKDTLAIEGSSLNGSATQRLPNNANFSFKFIEGESLVLLLDELGVAASTGSACSSKSLEPSHVLTALGLRPEEAHGSLRLTLGRATTKQEVDYVTSILPGCVSRLRRISPFKKSFEA